GRRHTRSERDWSSGVCSSDLAVGGAVAVPGAIAVNPEVVVPLQIVRLHRIDQRGHLSEDPLARRGAGDADLPDTRVAVVVTVFGDRKSVVRERVEVVGGDVRV